MAANAVATYDRAAALRETLNTSDALAKEASTVLETYGSYLDSLMESVERVAARAQVNLLHALSSVASRCQAKAASRGACDALCDFHERRAQVLTTARRQIDGALRQTNELLEQLDTPRKVVKAVHSTGHVPLQSIRRSFQIRNTLHIHGRSRVESSKVRRLV